MKTLIRRVFKWCGFWHLTLNGCLPCARAGHAVPPQGKCCGLQRHSASLTRSMSTMCGTVNAPSPTNSARITAASKLRLRRLGQSATPANMRATIGAMAFLSRSNHGNSAAYLRVRMTWRALCITQKNTVNPNKGGATVASRPTDITSSRVTQWLRRCSNSVIHKHTHHGSARPCKKAAICSEKLPATR